MSETLLSVRDLKVSYKVGQCPFEAVDGASFDVPRGSIVGLVGEIRLRQDHGRSRAHPRAWPTTRRSPAGRCCSAAATSLPCPSAR